MLQKDRNIDRLIESFITAAEEKSIPGLNRILNYIDIHQIILSIKTEKVNERRNKIIRALLLSEVEFKINADEEFEEICYQFLYREFKSLSSEDISFLLKAGVRMDKNEERLDFMVTLFMRGCSEGNIALLTQLITAGYDIEGLDAVVAAGEAIPLLIWILKDLSSKLCDHEEESNLIVFERYMHVIQFLISHRMDMDVQDENGCTALMYALLLDKLATKNLPVDYPFQLTEDRELKEISLLQLLLMATNNINAQDSEGMSALMDAALNCDLEVVQYLVANGAYVNQQDAMGKTPLMYATLSGRLEVVQCLIANGASVNQRDEKGKTALAYAASKGRVEIVKLLCKADGINDVDMNHDSLFKAIVKGISREICRDKELSKKIFYGSLGELVKTTSKERNTKPEDCNVKLGSIFAPIFEDESKHVLSCIIADYLDKIQREEELLDGEILGQIIEMGGMEDIHNILNHLQHQEKYLPYFECLYKLTEYGLRNEGLVKQASYAVSVIREAKKRRIDRQDIQEVNNIAVPPLRNILKQHIANTIHLEGSNTILSDIYRQAVFYPNASETQQTLPEELKEELKNTLVNRKKATQLELLPSKQELNSWVSRILKQELVLPSK